MSAPPALYPRRSPPASPESTKCKEDARTRTDYEKEDRERYLDESTILKTTMLSISIPRTSPMELHYNAVQRSEIVYGRNWDCAELGKEDVRYVASRHDAEVLLLSVYGYL